MTRASRPIAVVNCGQLVTLAGPRRPRVRDELKDLSIIGGLLLVVAVGSGPGAMDRERH